MRFGPVVALGADDHSAEGAPPEALRRTLAAIEAAGVKFLARSRIVIADVSPARPQPWTATVAAVMAEGPPPQDLQARLAHHARPPLHATLVSPDGTTLDATALPGPAEACDFLLAALGEIAPSLRHPASGRTVAELLAASDRRGLWALRPVPSLMGIVNVTPDSFSDGGRFAAVDAAVAHASALIDEGADIIDIGGESTRPGAAPTPPAEEQARVLPVVRALAEMAARRGRLLSIDTRRAATMAAAIAAGATMINDVSALADPESRQIAAESGLPVVLMHMQGEPRTMQLDPRYGDVVADVTAGLVAARDRAVTAGVRPDRIWLDPGIGFGKRPQHNLALLRATERLRRLGHPLLVGVSRKNFVGRIERAKEPDERVSESVAAVLAVAARGASALRVHDVAETRQALAVWSAIEGEPLG